MGMAAGQGGAVDTAEAGLPAPVRRALEVADARCARTGAQLTALRRQVLALVLEAEQPLGAYALLDKLKASRPGAAPPTVYRALDFLLEQGLIHKVERLNAFVGCVEAGHDHDHHGHAHPHQFLICRDCGLTVEISDPAVAHAVAEAAARAGFTVPQATVEIEGRCAACSAAAKVPAP
ncbi:Fur family transcriptional regulator [Roseomonas marmotae]|uniref:Transcriptional repressor n=1 Tax=Roseomonas marmotae TaxID=2768161 RepID=A0ABS3K940_9PROT|nr:Fur family transcriptional regulator [Roseomonas marmotae]MBO1073976.1 transcriptional repressor [Roseomonas marmotae]QTI78768.1 transcriptional repressor [Roseomonas marmotae]